MGRMCTESELAYAAGFFDGEGSVSIEAPNGKGKPSWRLRVTVTQDDPRPLHRLQEIWDGSVRPRRKRDNDHLSHQWTAHTAQAARFLRDIQPLVIVKDEAIGIALEFLSGITAGVGRNGLGAAEHERRAGLHRRLRVVNGTLISKGA